MDEKIVQVSIDHAMQLAITEGLKGAPYVSPNPLVGCAIISSAGEIVALGYHTKYGEAHAEVEALKKCPADLLKNATVVVTLEPCAHEGKTPSCAKALAKLPIKKVIYGLQDPNPLVCGQGAEIIKNAGIEVEEYQGVYKQDLKKLCEIFLKNFTQKKVFVAAKVATSLDGQIGLKSGQSKWITSAESRNYVHELRSYYDAILVGKNTVLIDDPLLNIRHDQIKKANKVIICDRSAEILKLIQAHRRFRFAEIHPPENIYFVVDPKKCNLESIRTKNAFQIIEASSSEQLLVELWNRQIKSVFIEGGAQIYSDFLQNNLIDRLHLFMAPVIIGAKQGLSWTNLLNLSDLSAKKTVKNINTKKIGSDIYITADFDKSESLKT